MKTLFTTQFGSRLYGTNTPASDVDLKHIVLPDLDQLLLAKKVQNKVKKTNNQENVRNTASDIDEEFIPIQVFARDFVEGQTYALEIAFALDNDHAGQKMYHNGIACKFSRTSSGVGRWLYPERDVVFEETDWVTPAFANFVDELRSKFLTSNIKAMMGYVMNQASLYSFKGERLNAVRDLQHILHHAITYYKEESVADWTMQSLYDTPAYKKHFDDLAVKYPKYFRLDVYDIGGGRMKPCAVILEKTLPFTNTVGHSMTVIKALESKYGTRANSASESNVDWKATMHALRIVDEGLALLRGHELVFPFPHEYAQRLLSIKHGEMPLDPIKEELSTKLEFLKDLEKTTTLPTCDQEFMRKFDRWLAERMREFYGVSKYANI